MRAAKKSVSGKHKSKAWKSGYKKFKQPNETMRRTKNRGIIGSSIFPNRSEATHRNSNFKACRTNCTKKNKSEKLERKEKRTRTCFSSAYFEKQQRRASICVWFQIQNTRRQQRLNIGGGGVFVYSLCILYI